VQTVTGLTLSAHISTARLDRVRPVMAGCGTAARSGLSPRLSTAVSSEIGFPVPITGGPGPQGSNLLTMIALYTGCGYPGGHRLADTGLADTGLADTGLADTEAAGALGRPGRAEDADVLHGAVTKLLGQALEELRGHQADLGRPGGGVGGDG